MTSFLQNSAVPAIWIISSLELLLIGYMVYRFIKTKSRTILFTACMTLGLFFDAFIIALGSKVDASQMVVASRFRFIAHGLLIPLLFMISAEALELKKIPYYVAIGLTVTLMGLGLAEALATKLGVVEIANISRMASIKGATPGWADAISKVLSFGTVIPLMVVGIIYWIKKKTPYLFLSGFLMFAFSALGPATGNSEYIFYISMYGELLMVIFLILHDMFGDRKKKKAENK